MAAPAYITKGTFTSGTGAPSVPVPSGNIGDLLLLHVESANQAISTPSGWSELTNSPQSTGTAAAAGGVRHAVFGKIATAASEGNVTVADTGDHTTANITRYRGDYPYATLSEAIHVTAGNTQAATTSVSFPSVTTTIADCLIVLSMANDRDSASTANLSAWTNANLTSITERHDQTVTSGFGGGIAIATGVKATAGSVGTTTATNAASVTNAKLTIAIRPPDVKIDAVVADIEIAAQVPVVSVEVPAALAQIEIDAPAPTFDNPVSGPSGPGTAQAGLIWLWGVESDTIIDVPSPAGIEVVALSPTSVIGSNVLAPVSNLEIQAQVPLLIGFNTRPPTAELQIAAQTPAVATGANVVVPDPGTLQIAAQAPAVAVGYRAAVPAPAELSVAAQAPAVATGANVVQVAPAGLEIAAQAPAVYANDITVSGPAGVEIDAPTPTITIGPDPAFNPGKGRRTPLLRPGRGLNPG